ncbi:hypothetical protein A3860_32690 [Niastella vici]|uniref:eCIS core domain-containing protein n=1 Tax=Niastella vici TaxID=1703345 RepID=A0A1V9FQE3_9BACT|nr:DUF4157 domain-containing protein [Niastella vici]OQP60574.1 hypothetical protein A3860_32690 [Niastella vici]
MGKTAKLAQPATTASHSGAPFFDRKGSTTSAPAFFTHPESIQPKLAIGKADDVMEQEADQVADEVQAKLAIGAPDDPYEAEADQMASKVVSSIQGGPSVQTKKEPAQRGRECEEGDYIFLKPASIQRLGEDIDSNGSRESVVAAARSMIGKIEAKHAEGGQRVGAKYLLDIFHLAAPGVWDDATIQTAGAKLPSWCGIFSVWAHKRAGKDIGNWQIGKGVSAFGTLQQTTNPQAGDIGYIDQPYQHHCIIVKIDGNNVYSIDGNSGLYSEVKENTRPLSAYTGFFTAFGAGSPVQRKKIQRKGKAENATAPASVEQSITASKGKGDPLPGKVQSSMGSAMGADFSGVRIHTDQRAADMSRAIDAQAFTHGKDIYFNREKYNPATKDGQHLLAHELTHTIQQGASAKRKLIQRNGDDNKPANDPNKLPRFDKGKLELHLEKIVLPDFKKRNQEKFKLPLHALSPRPKVRDHNEIWKEFVQSAVYAKTADFLKDKQKSNDGIYFLKAKNSEFRIIGKLEQIQEEAINPKWNRFSKGNIHQVDHIVELQLGGDNIETNYELTDKLANTSSGNAIKIEREKRMDEARPELKKTNPDLPDRKVLNTDYITHFHKIEAWNLPYAGQANSNVYWNVDEIKDGKHLLQIREMTPGEIKASQGSDKEFVLYIRKGSGIPMKIALPFKGPKKNWLPGIDLTGFEYTPGTADDQDFGKVNVTLSQNFTKRMKAGRPFEVPFKKMPFLLNTGYFDFSAWDKNKGLEGILEFNGLSPIQLTEFSLHETAGLILNGNIITTIPIIDKTPIEFSLQGDDFTVSKQLQVDDFKDKFPKPFKINDLSLSIFASTKKGLGVQGFLEFEVEKVGKGQLTGLGSTHDGFGIKGMFEFDPELFKSKIEASYIDKEFKFAGSVTLEKEKIPGVKELTVKLGYADNKITGEGKAQLNIPGVKEIGIKVEQQENGGLKIAGDIEFGNKLKSDAKVQAVFEKGDAGWDVSIKGTLNPNINIAGLTITEVKVGFSKGVFDVSAKVNFEKGKVKGDFELGVTNGNLDEEGKKIEGVGKELAFYASGTVTLDIVKDVDGTLNVKITKDGDLIIGGKIEVKEDKNIVKGKKGDMHTDEALKIFDFKKSIPVASCGVASLVLGLEAGVGLFYDFKGLTLDKGTNVTLEPVSLKDLSKAKVTSDISLSTGVAAGVDAFIGASAGLEVLIAGVRGTGRLNLKLTAFDATAHAKVQAGFSADKGLEFKTAEMDFEVDSKIGYDVEVGVEVYLNLLLTDVTLWEHKWKPDDLKGEYKFSWFDGTLKVPLKFGENNSLAPEDVGSELKDKIGEHAKDPETFKEKAKDGVDGKAPDPKEEEAKTAERIKTSVGVAYRGAYTKEVFAFNQSINQDYFDKRTQAWKIVDENKKLKPEIRQMLRNAIIGYEREEYDAFYKWLQNEPGFTAASKLLIIDDFMRNRPTLTLDDKMQLEMLVPPDPNANKSTKAPASQQTNPLQKKEVPGEHGYAVPDDFAERMETAKAHGQPLPLDVRAEMGKQFGCDFSTVRVHYDNEAIALASEVNAQAFTHGNHIFFNNGKYEPASTEGKKLLAHELTHIVQQGHGEPVKRKAEKDPTGTTFTGNYIFDPGHDGLNSGFFNTVKNFVADGVLSDNEIRVLRKNAIERNGSILHAELLLMAAMRNPVNVTLMRAHRGGPLILSMSNILEADKNYVINFDRTALPPGFSGYMLRLLQAVLGLSGETIAQAQQGIDQDIEQHIQQVGGTQFADQAIKLTISASFSQPVVPLLEVLTAMNNAAVDGTPGDQIMAGTVYVIARRYNHSTASAILNGTIKVDALIPSVYRRLLGSGDAGYSYSTDQDIRKANTMYVPTDVDIFQLDHRALIIHELTHAADDLSRPTEQLVDSLALEARAYEAQGKYMLDENLATPAPGLVTTAAGYVNLGSLYYWSMLQAAKRDRTKYENMFADICTAAPASKTRAAVISDLNLASTTIDANIRAALLALRGPDGRPLYSAGNTRLGGNSGHFFQ